MFRFCRFAPFVLISIESFRRPLHVIASVLCEAISSCNRDCFEGRSSSRTPALPLAMPPALDLLGKSCRRTPALAAVPGSVGDAAQWRTVSGRTQSLKVFLSDLRVLRSENDDADRVLRQCAGALVITPLDVEYKLAVKTKSL